MRTPQDIINRKEANQRYYKLEENKQQKRDYMKAYRERPYVKAKLHEYYVVNKMHWGEITKAKRKKNNWGGITKSKEQDNDLLHAKNTERFIDDAQR